MLSVKVYDMKGAEVDTIELSSAVFGLEPNKAVMHDAVVQYLAAQRQGTQSTLTRAEVRGGGRKPWRQKGTGHARQGSTRSPQWTHGGVALGPKPRSYVFSLNKKVKRLALLSALSSKVQDGDFIVVDKIAVDEIKTKTIVEMFTALEAGKKAMIVLPESDQMVYKSARNIEGAKTNPVGSLNVYDILNSSKLILSKDAVAKLEEVYSR